MLVLGFAVRTDAGFAISGLLPLRLALDMVVDRRLDLVLLGFLAIDFSVEREVYGEVSSPKQRSVRGAHRCALALAVRERRPALRTRKPRLVGGAGSGAAVLGQRHGYVGVPS